MEERDPYGTRATRRRGDTEPNDRLGADGPEYGDPVNPDWRGSRATRRTRRTQGLPSSRQEFLLWLQFGGWRVVLAALVLVGVTVWLIWLTSRPQGAASPFESQPTQDLASSGGVSTFPQQATVTPRPTSAAPTASAGGATGGAQFRVINTGSEGLFLRPDHNTDNPPVKTLPDGSIVTVIGEDFSGPDRVWKNVRDAEGSEGWVASDFLQAVQ
jgi:hypothetical protein